MMSGEDCPRPHETDRARGGRSPRSSGAPAFFSATLGFAFLAGCDAEPSTAEPSAAATPAPLPGGVSADPPLQPPTPGDFQKAAPHVEAARGFVLARRVEEAAAAYEEALQVDPAHQAALVEYGFLLHESSEIHSLGRALECFRLARLLDPESEAAKCGEGLVRHGMGNHQVAMPLLTEALESPSLAQQPERLAEVHRALGRIAFARGDLEVSQAHAEKALDLGIDPRRTTVFLADLGEIAFEQDQLPEAKQHLEQAIEKDPERPRSHYLLVRVLGAMGDQEGAAKQRRIHGILQELHQIQRSTTEAAKRRKVELKRQLAAEMPHRKARRQLIREQLQSGDYERALREVAAERKGQKGFDAELLYLMARAKAGLGDLEGAGQAARSMRRVNPKVPAEVIRDILDEWRKADSGADPATYQRLFEEWSR